LVGSHALIVARMAERTGHFMPLSLLDSQFAALEAPAEDEEAFSIEMDRPLAQVVE
jgi:gluconokinase